MCSMKCKSLWIAGINHQDVLGPEKLKKWLQKFSKVKINPPDFIAVEWDEGIFNQIKTQRHRIRKYAKAEWPEATSDFLDKIESSLAFEGDSHRDIFAGAETVWLNRGSNPPVPTSFNLYFQ